MRFRNVHIKNFRALEEINVDFDSPVNVIVGPNAIGKTTLLEAIRLVKAIVASRAQSETSQALFALGASLPYNPQRFIPSAIARDPVREVEIRCRYQLTTAEIEIVASAIPEIAGDFTLRSAGQQFSPNLGIAFLSSPQGQVALAAAEKHLKETLEGVRGGKRDLFLDVKFNPVSARFNSTDSVGGMIFAFLDSRCSPRQTVFSYFPADRALPPGEPPVQLGAADAAVVLPANLDSQGLVF